MMRSALCRFLALCGVLAVFGCGPSASASTVTYDFTVTATTGPLTGDVSSGSFSWDSSSVPPGTGLAATGLLTALDFAWDGITYNSSTANTGGLTIHSDGTLQLAFFGTNCSAGACDTQSNVEAWLLIGDDFEYSTSGDRGNGSGTVTYSEVAATPEPGTLALMGTALLSGVGLVRRRLRD